MLILSSVLPVIRAAFSPARVVIATVVAAGLRVARALHNRRQVTQLTHLDAHQLKDIGLTRTDVRGALEVSLFDDPSRVLADIAGAGHGAARLSQGTPVARQPVSLITPQPREA
jgi:uncharacterized protein YjiS (DUF1127 family)